MSLRDEVARCYEALNRGDTKAFYDLYDPGIELFVPAWVSPDSGIFRGTDAVSRWYRDNLAVWPEHWELMELFDNGPNVSFVMHGGEGQLAGRFYGVMSFQAGRIVSIVHLGALAEADAK